MNVWKINEGGARVGGHWLNCAKNDESTLVMIILHLPSQQDIVVTRPCYLIISL